ncbi:hypothetical protein XENORESO_014168 [Xenotaenia resolanae]|uniref:Uncharacterized protein n=1 Tax=Xenotaenia resolanae TaxID=208358 RepID=A0ABV0W2U9_9TELE
MNHSVIFYFIQMHLCNVSLCLALWHTMKCFLPPTVTGLWTGLTIAVSLQAFFFITCMCKLDWKKASEEAQVRAVVQLMEEKETFNLEHLGGNPHNDYFVEH